MPSDRGISLKPGERVETAYVAVENCRMACRAQMAIGNVEKAFQRLLQQAPNQEWPPPVGEWEGERFVIYDGRHAYLAYLMLGYTHILVAWKLTTKGQTRRKSGSG